MLKTMGLVFYTELVLLLRRSYEWLYPLGFFIIVMSLYPLAISSDPLLLQKIIPGGSWIAALLASLLAIQSFFSTDIEEGNLEQWLLSQTPLALLIFAKLSAQWLVTELPLVVLTPLLGILFHLSVSTMAALCCSLLLGTPILTLIGSLIVVLTLGLRQQGVLLSLLILPLVVPILIFGVIIVQQSQAGFSIVGPIAFLAGISFLTITLLPWAIAATLRVSIDD